MDLERKLGALYQKNSTPKIQKFLHQIIQSFNFQTILSNCCISWSVPDEIFMDSGLILSVSHGGKCNLFSVNESSTIDDIKIKVRNKCVEFLEFDFSLYYSVGSISNCSLEYDEDISNMFTLCQHISAKIVNALLISSNTFNEQYLNVNSDSSELVSDTNGASPPYEWGVNVQMST